MRTWFVLFETCIKSFKHFQFKRQNHLSSHPGQVALANTVQIILAEFRLVVAS